MKEIDINIEGYNVNGICVGCLNYNRKMFYINEAPDCFRILANIDVPSGLSIQLCWECIAAVKNTLKFRDQILKAYDILNNYSQKHTFLNSPHDLSQYATTRLSIETYSNDDVNSNFCVIKEETFLKEELEMDVVKTELLKDTFNDISIDDDPYIKYESYDAPIQDTQSSDDDTYLADLKKTDTKKEKKDKKKKRLKTKTKARHLKNLPSDIVEVYTMTNEELVAVRNKDSSSDEFMNLKYKCMDCVRSFNSQKGLDCHMNGKHVKKDTKTSQCDICKSYFTSKEHMSVHRNRHLNAFKCMKCGFVTTLKRIMMNHECMKNSEEFACTECDRTFSTKSKLSYHKSVTHEERPQCDCCGKVFANKVTLKYHLKILPVKKQQKPKENLFIQCKGCDKVFHSKKSYRSHAVIHEGLTYPCPICGKEFQWKRNLARHARNHRERAAGTAHQCRECRKSFASRDCLANHLRLSKRHVRESELGHACHYCNKRFATKWCMVDHIDWDHLKRIKYRCSVCYKPFKTAKIMVAHMNNIHEGKNKKEPDGEHLCEICGKSYKTVKRLKGHVWAMHTKRSDARSYKCALCPATFAWQTSIYKHVRMMHADRRPKQPRTVPKKDESLVEIELSNRIQYFQQNIANNITPGLLQPLNIVQNI